VQSSFEALNPVATGSGIEWHDVLSMSIWSVLAVVIALRRFQWVPVRKG
jgi:hypothetical protein